jgi:hypothetical protein
VAGWWSRIETELTVDEGVREEDIAGIFAAGTVGRFFVITRKERRDRTGQFFVVYKNIIRRGKVPIVLATFY